MESPLRLNAGDIDPRRLDGKPFVVESRGFAYPCRFMPQAKSRLLYVVLHGAADRATHPFARWHWSALLDGNILAVCDPTIYLEGGTAAGWYDAGRDLDALPGLAHLAQTFAARLGLLFSQVVFYGAYADGFAALLAAAITPACCLAIDPDTSTGAPSLPPARRSAGDAFLAAWRGGHFPRGAVLHDREDEARRQEQYLPFSRALKLPADGGEGFHGCVMSLPYSGEAGLKRAAQRALPFLTRHHYTEVEQLDPRELEGQAFAVECEGFTFPCRYVPHPASEVLYVGLHAAVQRGKDPLPLYARWNWNKILRGSILCIDDPTLYLDDDLRLGWYIGTRDRDGIRGVVRIAETFAAKLGIPPSRIVFYGTSGGGYASILAAALGSACCVAINPQVDIVLYNAKAVAEFAEVFDASGTPAQHRALFPTRWNAVDAMQAARSAGRSPKVYLIQNMTNDPYTVKDHYLPFCRALDVPSEGGVGFGGSVMSGIYNDEDGHDAADTPEVVRRILSEGMQFLMERER